jgi:hypothetical protein
MTLRKLLPMLLLLGGCSELTEPATDDSRAEVTRRLVARAEAAPAPAAGVAAPKPGLERITGSHILIAYSGALRAEPNVTRDKEEARKMAEAILVRVQKGEDFAALARAHSDDSAAKRTGGNLGTFDRNTMAESFSRAAFELDVGGVSGVVESPFGFHVIQRHPDAP